MANPRDAFVLENQLKWLFNTNPAHNRSGFSVKSLFDQPLTWFGFNLYGQGDQRAWGFGGRRVGGNPNLGKYWVPNKSSPAGGGWGSKQALTASSATRSQALKGWAGRWAGPVLGSLFGAFQYSAYRQQGHGRIASGAMAVGSTVAEALKWRIGAAVVSNPIGFVAAAGYGAIAYHFWNKERKERIGKAVQKSEFISNNRSMQTEQAHTMRQRSLRAINRSQINARMALGNEARFQHMNSNRSGLPGMY